jgi:hypothetical protein
LGAPADVLRAPSRSDARRDAVRYVRRIAPRALLVVAARQDRILPPHIDGESPI